MLSSTGDQCHLAVPPAEGAVVTPALVFGSALLAPLLLLGMVGSARVELGDHTPAQVIAGSGLDAVVAAVIFALLR